MILRKTHLAAYEHVRRMIHTRRAIEALTMGPQGIVTLPKGQDATRTPNSWKRTAQYEQTQETQRIRDLVRVLAFNWAFYLAFSFLINISSPNLFSVTPQSHYEYKHI